MRWVKRSHGINVHNLIQQIENHPQREALQSDLQQHRAFSPFSKESKDPIMAAGNTELCEIIDVEPKSEHASRTGAPELKTAHRGHLMKDDTTENKKYISSVPGFVLHPELPHKEGPATRSIGTGKHLDAKSTTRQISFKRGVARRNMTTSTTDSSATSYSEKR